MASSFGKIFTVTTFGESHGKGVGVVIDGCPAGHEISLTIIQSELNRRKPGQSAITTSRAEKDQIECISGMENGVTLGSPICLLVTNSDFKPGDYNDIQDAYRPSHADFTTEAKYGLRSKSGGGRSSARETIGRVAAASVAQQIMTRLIPECSIVAYVDSVKNIEANIDPDAALTRELVDQNIVRCPDREAAKLMEQEILKAKKNGDTVGGCIRCQVQNPPIGIGEPIFDKLEADLAKALMSLPATKGVEFGLGFSSTQLYGSEHNDAFYLEEDRVRTRSNNSGGIQGGISNGESIEIRTAFKPVSTIFKEQETVTSNNESVQLKPKAGRHDPCVLPRAVPMVEAMVTLVVFDHYLRQIVFSSTMNHQ